MRRVEMLKLVAFLLAHETDIATDINDFGELKTVFDKVIGRKAYDRTK